MTSRPSDDASGTGAPTTPLGAAQNDLTADSATVAARPAGRTAGRSSGPAGNDLTADSATVAARPAGRTGGRSSSPARPSLPKVDASLDRRGHWADAARRGSEPGFLDGGLLDGRYRLVEQLGEGGMGSVYLVDDLLLRQRSALKTLHISPTSAQEDLERFRREVALTHSIHHPNVARTYDIGEQGGVHYLSMEWLEGESLMARIKRGELLSPAEARGLAIPLCRGLRAAHRAGVVHRDLKPANIMLVRDGRGCVVVDFGIAAQVGVQVGSSDESAVAPEPGSTDIWQVTSAGRGTPAYMAPEQWDQATGDARTDIYALGVILYVSLTAKAPFSAASTWDLADKHKTAPPPDVRDVRPEVDADLAKLIQWCMAKRPEDRPQSMDTVLAALRVDERRRAWARSVAIAVVGTALATTVLHLSTFAVAKGALVHEMQPAVQRYAELIARDLPIADLELLGKPSDLKTARFERVRKVLRRYRDADPEVTSTYVMRATERPGHFTIVADAKPEAEDEDGDGQITDAEQGVTLGEAYDGTEFPAMQRALDTGKPQADDHFAVDAWGVSLSGYAPLPSAGGKSTMFVGVDGNNAQLSRLKMRLDTVLIALAALFVLVWGTLTWPGRTGGTLWRRITPKRRRRAAAAR